MNLVFKAKCSSPTSKGSTVYFVKVLIVEADLERFPALDASMVGAVLNLPIFKWAKITGVKAGAIRARFNKAVQDERQGEPFNTARQIVGLDAINNKASRKHVDKRKSAVMGAGVAWLYRSAC